MSLYEINKSFLLTISNNSYPGLNDLFHRLGFLPYHDLASCALVFLIQRPDFLLSSNISSH